MSINSRKHHVAWLTPLCAGAFLACAAPDASDLATSEEDTVTVAQALSAGGMRITGSSNLVPLSAANGFFHEFDGTFNLTNQTNRSVTLDKQMLFFAAPGGYSWFPDHNVWWTDPIAPGATVGGGGGWIWSATVAHLVMRVDGHTSTGGRVAALAGIPIIQPGKPSPGASPFVDDVNVGVMGPIEIVNLAGAGRWLGITGSVTDTTATATAAPTLTIQARSSSGSTVATLSQQLGPFEGAEYHRTFLAWTALSPSANVANVRITASHNIFNGPASQTRTIPVVTASPVSIVSPVSGTWTWSNGPGETNWHAHSGAPEARYAYDLGIQRVVNGALTTFQGDPFVNSSFFCWDQPIRAAMTGTVVLVQDTLPDNNGFAQDNNQGNNEIIIQHPNNVFTRYAHMRQGTATVHVGQTVYAGSVIALVGNAGNSSEPHLHFHAFKIDATGRQVAVPFTIPGLKSTSGASLTGVPRGGVTYQTP